MDDAAMFHCSKCGNSTWRLYPGRTCQACYRYYRFGGVKHTLPPIGQRKIDGEGRTICHICGQAYKSVGAHIEMNHKMSVNEYIKRFHISDLDAPYFMWRAQKRRGVLKA